MIDRVIPRWMLWALAVALLALSVTWLVKTRPFAEGTSEGVSRDLRAEERAARASAKLDGDYSEPPGLPIGLSTPASSGRAPSAKDDRPKRTLYVRVVEEDHADRGVEGAKVCAYRLTPEGYGIGASLFGAPLPDGVDETDEEGHATLKGITREAAYLQVTAFGFALATRTVPAADESGSEVDVALSRGLVVAGKVIKADGTEAGGAVVRGTQRGQWAQFVADGSGAFRSSGFVPGAVALHATWRDESAAWEGDATVEAGTLDGEVRLRAEPTRRQIRLLVKGADGLPVPSASWHAKDERFMKRFGDGEGDVENGEAVLSADPTVQWLSIDDPEDKAGNKLPWGPVLVGPLGNRGGDLEVVMPRGVALTGTVRDDEGRPLEGVVVNVMPLVTEAGREHYVYEDWWFGTSDAEGRFSVEAVTPGRVQVDAQMKGGTNWPKLHVTAPCDPLDLVVQRRRVLKGSLRHPDGSAAAGGLVYRRGTRHEPSRPMWTEEKVKKDGSFEVWTYGPGTVRLRAALPPTAPEDAEQSEVVADAAAEGVILRVSVPKNLTVLIADWPAGTPAFAHIMNGPHSRGLSSWVLDGVARFDGADPRAPLAFYVGPLPDGRIAFSPDLSTAGTEATVSLFMGRSVKGRVRGLPTDARPDSVWADSGAFESVGQVNPDGTFLVRGIPPGPCRVCVVFLRGEERWCGFVRDTGGAEPLEVEVSLKDEAAFLAWLLPRG